MRIAVIGAGSWGTAMACLCARTTETALWARRAELAERIRKTSTNPDYLPGVLIPEMVTPTADLEAALTDAGVVVMAVPSHGFREILERAAPHLPAGRPILSLTKGIEQDTLLRMTEVIRDVVANADPDRVGVLTGPNLAIEVAQGQPTAAVVAVRDPETATSLQRLLIGPTFRVYTNPDVVGCESAGALKNVMAIAAGSHGLGTTTRWPSSRASPSSARRRHGRQPLTFAGLAGMGDLIATCFSERAATGESGWSWAGRPHTVVGEMKMVAEGEDLPQCWHADIRDRDADRHDGECGAQ
jgi:glycerol-3-phosphate dehydrogenase (NAD(P)+)